MLEDLTSVMKIKKGTHAPLRLPKILLNTRCLSYEVEFTDSCRYDIGSEDQGDINKLFGVGYFPSHHYNSVRIGWNYDIPTDKIKLWAYWYEKGQRKWAYLKSVDVNTTHCFSIRMENNEHVIDLGDVVYTIGVKPKFIGYLLAPYFGGNQVAPHDIIIHLKK